MHGHQPVVQNKQHVFAFASDGSNATALGKAGNVRSGLRLRGYRMKDMNAADSPTLDEGT